MIYRVVRSETGEFVRSVDASSERLARKYLRDGETLMVAGQNLMMNEGHLKVVDGAVVQKIESTLNPKYLPEIGLETSVVPEA